MRVSRPAGLGRPGPIRALFTCAGAVLDFHQPRPLSGGPMITILITAAARAAIGGSLPKGAKSTPAGVCEGFCLTIDLETIDRLTALRLRGENYSDVILRLTAAAEALTLKASAVPMPTERWALQNDVPAAFEVAD